MDADKRSAQVERLDRQPAKPALWTRIGLRRQAEQAPGPTGRLKPDIERILLDHFSGADWRLEAGASAGRSVSCAAGENARERMRTVATRPVMPEAARIIATTTNW